MAESRPLAVPQLSSCASSGRAWRLRAARHSREEAGPLGAKPLPRVFERAASKAANVTACEHPGMSTIRTRAMSACRCGARARQHAQSAPVSVRVPAGLRLAAVGSRALGSGRAEHPRLGAPSRVCTAAHQAAWEDQQEEARPRGMGMGAAGGGAIPLSDGCPPAGWADRATRPHGARCAAREPLLGCTPPSRRQSRRSHCTAHGH